MHPLKVRESNFTFLGPTRQIADLPCRLEGHDTYSVWELTDEERAAIAQGANIRMGIHGVRPIPPVSLAVVPNSGPWEPVSSPCAECGKESSAPAHWSAEGGHAFKVPARAETDPVREFGPPGPPKPPVPPGPRPVG